MQGHDKRKPFYLVLPVAWADGSLDLPDADGAINTTSLKKAVEAARHDIEEHGGGVVVFKCEPVWSREIVEVLGEQGDDDA